MAFLTKWRTMTAFLMNITATQTTSPLKTIPNGHILNTIADVEHVIGTYASSSSNEATRQSSLEEIVRRASRIAAVLFSQPAFWTFDWENTGNGLVVFPGLMKLTDANGSVLREPVLLEEKKIVEV
jgi:hypothetical protein